MSDADVGRHQPLDADHCLSTSLPTTCRPTLPIPDQAQKARNPEVKNIPSGLKQAVMSMATLGLLLTACSSSTPSNDQAAAPVVTVTLSEFGIQMSRTQFDANVDYTFAVTNNGQAPHEFMILPPMTGDGMNMQMMDEMAFAVITEDDLPAGASVNRTFSLPAGAALEAACHLPGHYEEGMRLPISVTG